MNIYQNNTPGDRGWVSVVPKEIDNLEELHRFLSGFPDGTTCDILPSDLEAGNFDQATIINELYTFRVTYTGPVAEGYVSPFEMQQNIEVDL